MSWLTLCPPSLTSPHSKILPGEWEKHLSYMSRVFTDWATPDLVYTLQLKVTRDDSQVYCVWNVMAHAQKLKVTRDSSQAYCVSNVKAQAQKLKVTQDSSQVDCVWNVMAPAQKPDFVFRPNGRVHLNRLGRQFSRLLAAEVCASAVVMLDTPCSEVVWRVLATHYIRRFPLHCPSRASPCAITFQLDSNTYYFECWGYLGGNCDDYCFLWRDVTCILGE